MKSCACLVCSVALLAATEITSRCHAVEPGRAASQSNSSPPATRGQTSSFNPTQPGRTGGGEGIRDRSRASDVFNPGWSSGGNLGGEAPAVAPALVPGGAPVANRQRWRLGIYPEDTDTGVRVNDVIPGSAADRAGLEPNDRIVSVHGYQVGYVNGYLYDCGYEFERHADSQGWVKVLVQNSRDGKLMNLPIQLDPRYEELTGSITYRERYALPRDATATVELREVFRAGTRPVTVARQIIPVDRQIPIPFTLDFDPTEVDPNRNYELYASISSRNRQLFESRSSLPVLNGRPQTGVQLLVESSSSYPGGATLSRDEQLTQISRWFRDYLGRDPRSQELYVWEQHLGRGGSLSDAQLQILSTPEFYYQSSSNDAQYIRRMFQLVSGQVPNSQETAYWMNRLEVHNRLRSQVAREFLASAKTSTTNSPR